MSHPLELVLGEFRRTFDDRFRVAVPAELLTGLGVDEAQGSAGELILAKERPGCLSLWNSASWRERIELGVDLVQAKMRAGKLEGKWSQVQMLGRLLSTRHKAVALAGRGRLLVPEGFREFLRAEPGGEVVFVGAAVCVEIWHPPTWLEYLDRQIPRFSRLFQRLSS